MNSFDKTFFCLLLFFWLAKPLASQEDQKFSVLVSNYFSSTFEKEDSFFQPNSAYGYGVEFRYKVGNNSDEIKTIIGLTYLRLNYSFIGDLPPGANSKDSHHIFSLPLYLWANISDDWYINYHLSFDVPIKTTKRSYVGNELIAIRTEKHKFNVNAGLGAGVALGHYFEITEKYSLFGELFFKAPSLFSPLSNVDEFYVSQGFRPFIIGVNTGIRF